MIEYFDKIHSLDKQIFSYQRDVNDFFTSKNVDSYIMDQQNIDVEYKDALRILFNEEEINDLPERCNKAISIYPLCFEAYYIAYYIFDSLSFYYFSLDIINNTFGEYKAGYDLNNLANIYILLSSFFIDIKNNNKAIEMLDNASFYIDKSIVLTRYLIAYSFLEDSDKMLELYNSVPFKRAKDYILLIICLLKNNNTQMAKEVYESMLNNIKYADLLCYPNKMEDINDNDAQDLLNDMDSCFELIESVPYFFSFLEECIESHNKIVN